MGSPCYSVDAHVKALKEGLGRADLLLTTGGSSMGASDLLKPVMERQLGGTVHFGRVSIKPGELSLNFLLSIVLRVVFRQTNNIRDHPGPIYEQ